jgi:ADP-dependent NAD(P)H-hydrate dehydratase / NAD(P)H-hydrate epimerase
MKPVVTCQEMRAIEEKAIAQGTLQETLMDQAGQAIAQKIATFISLHKLPKTVTFLIGKGNNGGDGFTAAIELVKQGFSVSCYQVQECVKESLCHKKREEYIQLSGIVSEEILPEGVIVDAIFGSGFSGQVPSAVLEIIKKAEHTKLPIIAIDVPSGFAIRATMTIAIECPKLECFIGNNWNYVGTIETVSIGLAASSSQFYLLEEKDIVPLIPTMKRTLHKYQRGHVVGLGGKMAGAALMAATSALSSGAGIVHIAHPEEYTANFAGEPWEVIRIPYKKNELNPVHDLIQKATSCFIGPGLGNDPAIKELFSEYKDKAVLDADCLNYLATLQENIGPLTKTILTPHFGEMKRLLHSDEAMSLEFLKKCRLFAENNQTNLVLKGAPTFLFSYKKPVFIMARGTPGMATAGSGDVLTGILAGLLAQGLSPEDAMKLGTMIHAIAGENAAKEATDHCMTATFIIKHLPDAFKQLER